MAMMTQIQRAATLALAGVVAGLVHSGVHGPLQLRPAQPLPPDAPAAHGPAAAPTALGLEITLAQAHGLFSQGAPFIDARRLEEYTAGHVDGAFWIAPELFLRGLPEALNYLDRGQQVVIYCGGGTCDASHNVATLMNQAGFTRCHVMTDGYPAWAAAGHPVAAGAPMIGGSGGTP